MNEKDVYASVDRIKFNFKFQLDKLASSIRSKTKNWLMFIRLLGGLQIIDLLFYRYSYRYGHTTKTGYCIHADSIVLCSVCYC